MRVTRVYFNGPIRINETLTMPQTASHHLRNVLRLKEGAPIILFNGDGHEYEASISHITKKILTVTISSKTEVRRESPLNIHLIQAIPKGDKMDWILQKGVELGISSFTPLISERNPIKLKQTRWEKKLLHWQGIITSACEQCGRNAIPILNAPRHLTSCITDSSSSTNILLDPTGKSLKETLSEKITHLRIFVGPEGGFGKEEVCLAKDKGVKPITLGPRILRTETAGLAIASALQYSLGDFN